MRSMSRAIAARSARQPRLRRRAPGAGRRVRSAASSGSALPRELGLLLRQAQGRLDVDHQVLVARARQALHQLFELRALQRHLAQRASPARAWRAAVSRASSCAWRARARASIALRAGVGALARQLFLDGRRASARACTLTSSDSAATASDQHQQDARATRPRAARGWRRRRRGRPASATRGLGCGAAVGVGGSELIETILSTRPRRPGRAVTRTQHRSPRARAACAMRGCVASARACDQSCAGSRPRRLATASRTAEQPDRPSRCATRARMRAAPASEGRRLRAGRRPRRRTCTPAARSCSASQSRPGWPAVARRRRARSARGRPRRTWPATCCHSASESNCAASAAGASIARGRHAGLAQRLARCRARCPGTRAPGQARPAGRRAKKCAHRVGADEHHGAIAIELRRRASCSACGSRRGPMAIRGSATASMPRARKSRDPARGLARRAGHAPPRMARRFSGRRRRAAARRRASPSARGLRQVGHDVGRPARAPARRAGPGRPRRRRSCRYSPSKRGVGGQRHRAAAAHGAAHRALGRDGQPGGLVRQRRQRLAAGRRGPRAPRCPARPGPRPAASASGSNSWRMRCVQAQPLEAGGRQHDGVVLAFVELAQARVEVAAQRLDAQVGPQRAQQHHAAQAGGADHRALRQVVQAGVARARPGHRAGLRAPSRRPARSLRQVHRHVLERMHGEVGAAFLQRELPVP